MWKSLDADLDLVPTLQRGNASGGAPAPRDRRAVKTGSHAGAWEPENDASGGVGAGHARERCRPIPLSTEKMSRASRAWPAPTPLANPLPFCYG